MTPDRNVARQDSSRSFAGEALGVAAVFGVVSRLPALVWDFQ
jgi:hypothetical protein